MDIASLIGIFWGTLMIVAGMMMENGVIMDLVNIPAFVIVVGGTSGAVLLQFTPKKLIKAALSLKAVFLGVKTDEVGLITQIVDFARRARREGILALEKEIPSITDPFFGKALGMAVDGLEPKTLHETMENEIGTLEEEWKERSEVWEAAGGYFPTIGIIGAVIGLIQVMKNLTDIEAVGHGIAGAFVATIYALLIANLMCLPIAGKIKASGKQMAKEKDMTLKGVLLIQEGINHTIIEEQLKGFLEEDVRSKFVSGA